MTKFTRTLRKMCLIALCFAFWGKTANATIYTAVVSGNFNAALTWGGSIPGSLIASDIVIIPAGINVTMTTNEVFSGTSSLTVLGTLTAMPGTALAITSGGLAGTGDISADSMVLGLTSGFAFTGPLTTNKLTSLGANITSAASVTVSKLLNLASGTFNMDAGSLIMGNLSTINMAGGTIMTSGTGLLSLDSTHNVLYTVTSATTGLELGGLGVDSIVVNTTGTVTLAGSTTIKGVLTLTAGTLALAGNTLTFGATGNLMASGTGTITGSALSNVIVNATGGLTGALRFATGVGGTLNNLVVNTATGVTTLGSDLNINNLMTMTSGALAIGSHTLTLNPTGNIAAAGTGTLTGSALSSLVVNTTGGLTNPLTFTTGSNMLNNLTVNTTTGGATLGSDLALSGLMTLTSGTLSLAGHTLTLNPTADVSATGTGTLAGSATSNLVANTTGSLSGALRFATGSNLLNNLTVNTGAGSGLSLGSDLGVSGLVTLTAGTLSLAGHTLTLNPTGNISATGTGMIAGSTSSNVIVNTTGGLTGALRFATGLGGTLNNLVVNTTTGVTTLASDLNINNLLTMTSGALAIGSHTLTLNPTGNIAAAGTGTLTGSALSSLVVNTTGGLTNPLTFTTGSNMLNNLTVNTTTGGATLGSDLALSGMMTLTSGTLSLAGHTLTLNPTADVSATGTGTLAGSATSNLVANTTGSLSGALRFATGSNLLNNLTVNTGAGSGLSLGSDLGVSGLVTLTAGTLSLAGHTLTLNPTGNISASGTGTITGSTLSNVIVNTTGGLTGALRFATGVGGTLNNLVVNTTTGVTTLASDLNINNLMTMTTGALAIGSHTLTLNPTGNIAAAGTGTLTGSALSSLVVNTTGGLTNPLTFTTGSNMLNNLTVNTTTGGATLGSDLALSGMMTLTSGTLSLAGHTLTLNPTADVSATGTGTLAGSATSNLVANTTGSLSGALRFATGSNLLNNLTVNTGAGTGVSLGSDLGLDGMLTLTGGTLSLNGNTLTLNPTGNLSAAGTGTITGSTLSNLVVNTTGGLTGALHFATGLGGTLNNLVVNTTTGATTLGSDLSINNLLTMTTGALVIGAHTLTLNPTGNIAATGTGTLTGSALSSLVVNTTGGLTNPLTFTTGSNMLNNLTVNTTTGGATLGSDLGLSGLATLTSGTLSLNGHTLTLNPTADVSASGTGTITGSAASNVIANTTAGLTGALRFATGAGGVLNNFVVNTTSGGAALGSDLNINNLLTLTSGTLSINGNTLTLNPTGNIAATGTGTITGSTASNLVVNTTGGLTNPLMFTTGSNMLNNLMLNTTTGGATLASDLGLSGVMTLTSGTLSLAGHTLTLNPASDVSASGTGTLTGSATSNLVANTTASVSGALRFATGGNTLNNLTINMGSSVDTLGLGSNLTVEGTLNLTSGKVTLGANNLSVAAGGTVNGGTASSYVVTDGTGSLVMNLATSASDTFKVGSVTNFAPIALAANTGATTGDVSVNVANSVLADGYTGTLLSATAPLVNNTWFVSSTASTINYDMVVMWNAGMEVNGFNRTNAFISHYTGGAWDVQTPSVAGTSGTMYTMARTGITSLSPFTVKDGSALSAPVVTAAGQKVSIYPNPATNTLNYATTATISSIEISNLSGQVVKTADGLNKSVSVSELPAGTYFIHFHGNDVNAVQKFVKD